MTHFVITSHFHTLESAIFCILLIWSDVYEFNSFFVINKDCLLEPLWDEKSAINVNRMKT
jgi:hypothetical protein